MFRHHPHTWSILSVAFKCASVALEYATDTIYLDAKDKNIVNKISASPLDDKATGASVNYFENSAPVGSILITIARYTHRPYAESVVGKSNTGCCISLTGTNKPCLDVLRL